MRLRKTLRVVAKFSALDTEDPDLAQAQFRSCAKQIPLLYIILVSNAAAIMVDFFRADYLFRTLVVPMFVCVLALTRAWWW
jgi:predicted signal transduction protein with EAL and GGDEF domain